MIRVTSNHSLDAGTAGATGMIPVEPPFTVQAYSGDWDASDVTVLASADGVAWSTLGTLNEVATTNFINCSDVWQYLKYVNPGDGTEGKTLAVKVLRVVES